MPWFRAEYDDIFYDDHGSDHEVLANRSVAYFRAEDAEQAEKTASLLWKELYVREGEHHYRQGWRRGTLTQRELSAEIETLLDGSGNVTTGVLYSTVCKHCHRGGLIGRDPSSLTKLWEEVTQDPEIGTGHAHGDSAWDSCLELIDQKLRNSVSLPNGLKYVHFSHIPLPKR